MKFKGMSYPVVIAPTHVPEMNQARRGRVGGQGATLCIVEEPGEKLAIRARVRGNESLKGALMARCCS